MPFENLLFERRDAVAHVTLNRPASLNALNAALVRELREAAALIAADSGLRAVLLRANGRAFSAGADLSAGGIIDGGIADGEQATPGAAVEASLREHFNPMISAWYELPLPVVVAVAGLAAGAGVSLALSGDIVIAARSASFAQLFAPKLGLMPDLGGTYHLPRSIGSARAKGLALLGDPLSAADAAAWGLIWACVEDAQLTGAAEALVQRLSKGPTQAYAEIKAVFNEEPAATLAAQLSRELQSQTRLGSTADFAEGLAAFRAKRAPQFGGA